MACEESHDREMEGVAWNLLGVISADRSTNVPSVARQTGTPGSGSVCLVCLIVCFISPHRSFQSTQATSETQISFNKLSLMAHKNIRRKVGDTVLIGSNAAQRSWRLALFSEHNKLRRLTSRRGGEDGLLIFNIALPGIKCHPQGLILKPSALGAVNSLQHFMNKAGEISREGEYE